VNIYTGFVISIGKSLKFIATFVCLVFIFSYSLVQSFAQDFSCERNMEANKVFTCDVIKDFKLDEKAVLTGKPVAINGDTSTKDENILIFTPSTGFTGQVKIEFDSKLGEQKLPKKTITLNYSSVKQNLLEEGQITAIATFLLLVLALAIVLELALRHIFLWRWFIILFEGRGIKFIVGFVISLMLVRAVGIDLVAGFSSVIKSTPQSSSSLGYVLTALIVAGGSATVLQLWKMFNFLPDPNINKTAVKKRNFSRIKIIVDREPLDNDQNKFPVEVFVDGDLVGAIDSGDSQYPRVNFLWSGYPVEAREHMFEVAMRMGTSGELRWQRRHGVPHLNVSTSVLHFRLDPAEATFIQSDNLISLTAPRALKQGDPFKVGAIVAIAIENAEESKTVKGAISGIFEVPKKVGATLVQGDKLYWDDTNHNFTKTATGNTLSAVAVAAAASDATSIRVLLTT